MMDKKKILFSFIMVICFVSFDSLSLQAQDGPSNTKAEFDSTYEKNITKSRINGIYIPKDIEDAYEEFLALSPEESIEQFKMGEEEMVAQKLHFGIGRWMIVNWNLYEGSRLSQALRDIGVLHPDDMANLLIRVFHRKLNGVDENIEALVAEYAAKRAEERKKMGSIHFEKSSKK